MNKPLLPLIYHALTPISSTFLYVHSIHFWEFDIETPVLCQPSHISIWIDCLLQPVSFWTSNFKTATWKSEHEVSGSILPSMLGDRCSWSAGAAGGSLVSRAYIISWGFLTPALPGALTRRGFRKRLLQAELNLVRGIARYLQVTDMDLGWNRRCALPKIQEGCTYGTKTKWNAI